MADARPTNFYERFLVPDGVNEDDWQAFSHPNILESLSLISFQLIINCRLADHVLAAANEAFRLWSLATQDNSEWSNACDTTPYFGYPPGMSQQTQEAAGEPNTSVYIDNTLCKCLRKVNNENLFPFFDDVPYPQDFRRKCRQIYRRLFLPIVFIYCNPCLGARIPDLSAFSSLKRYIYFAFVREYLTEPEVRLIQNP